MQEKDWIAKHSEFDTAFKDGTVNNASDDKLIEYLQTLSTGAIANDRIHHREMIRGMTINHIQMSRMMRKFDARNRSLTILIIILTIIIILVELKAYFHSPA